jgi:hypothetical protein
MQAEKKHTEPNDGEAENDGHDDHEHIGLPRRGDEHRKMMRSKGIKFVSHDVPRPKSLTTLSRFNKLTRRIARLSTDK